MTRFVNVAAAQMGPIAKSETRPQVVTRLIALMREAKGRGAELVVFPELALTTFFPRWLIEDEAPSTELLWTGQYDAYFQPMFEEIDAVGLTAEAAKVAAENIAPADTLEGIYALFDGETFLGTASFRIEGQDAYFAARLENDREVRGVARLEANNYIALPDFSGIDYRGNVTPISGVAIPQENGAVECMGDDGQERSSFMAFRLPDQ